MWWLEVTSTIFLSFFFFYPVNITLPLVKQEVQRDQVLLHLEILWEYQATSLNQKWGHRGLVSSLLLQTFWFFQFHLHHFRQFIRSYQSQPTKSANQKAYCQFALPKKYFLLLFSGNVAGAWIKGLFLCASEKSAESFHVWL